VASKRSRIAGGRETENAYPWQAAVVKVVSPTKVEFGGSLINDRYVLTSASHLHPDMRNITAATDILVILGAHSISDSNDDMRHKVAEIKSHKDFDISNFWAGNDVALLRLATPVSITPVCLPSGNKLYVGDTAIISGWGSTIYREGNPTDKLQELELVVWDNTVCKKKIEEIVIATDFPLKSSMLCAGGTDEGGKGGCEHDAGNPLIIAREDGQYELIAVMSLLTYDGADNSCAYPGLADIYTRVTSYLTWIQTNTQDVAWAT